MQSSTSAPNDLPFVSVIVPAYNDPDSIATCIKALLAQTYPRERYEIVVVDNGSIDHTPATVAAFPVRLLAENTIKGSYAARNKGLAQARGAVIAFTDSDCVPVPEWLAEGVRALDAQQADLVGGRVRFITSARPTGAEVYDVIAHLNVERYINEEGAAVTANLFVRRAVFDAIGTFANVKSGGDVLFTQKATHAGYRLAYAPTAEVGHPTRRFGELIKKQFRVGKGHHAIRLTKRANAAARTGAHAGAGQPGKGKLHKLHSTWNGMRPESVGIVKRMMQEHNIPTQPVLVLRVWSAAWLARVAKTCGNLSMSLAQNKRLT